MSEKISGLDPIDLSYNDMIPIAHDPYGSAATEKSTVTNFFEKGRELSLKKYKCDQVQRLVCTGEAWTTVLDLSDGPAMVHCFWMAVQTTDFDARSWRVRITFDDAVAPQIDTDIRISDMFGGGWGENPTFRARFNGVTTNQSTNYSGYFKVPMPYQSSIKVEVYNPDDTDETCWVQLERSSLSNNIVKHGLPRGMHLYNKSVSAVVASLDEQTLLDEAGPVIIAGINHLLWHSAGTSWIFLEGDYRFYYDSEVVASYRSSSTEDFYHSSWYFTEGTFANDDIVCSIKDAVAHRVALQRFFRLHEAPYDENNLKITWTNADSGVPGNCVSAAIIWYYK